MPDGLPPSGLLQFLTGKDENYPGSAIQAPGKTIHDSFTCVFPSRYGTGKFSISKQHPRIQQHFSPSFPIHAPDDKKPGKENSGIFYGVRALPDLIFFRSFSKFLSALRICLQSRNRTAGSRSQHRRAISFKGRNAGSKSL